MTEIYFFDMATESGSDPWRGFDFETLIRILPEKERAEIQCISASKLRNMKLSAALLLRDRCAKRTGIAVGKLRLCRDDFGKPYFDGLPGLHISISYTKDAFVCAMSWTPLGVDVERLAPLPAIPYHFLTPDEGRYCTCPERFYEVWTKKEAYSKMLGTGLGEGFSSFSVFHPKIAGTLDSRRIGQCVVSVCGILDPTCTFPTLPHTSFYKN